MTTRTRAIRIHQKGDSHRNPSHEMLSKSLGDYSGILSRARNRQYDSHVSELSSISHAGYLLKRSSRPYRPASPFPAMSADTDDDHTPQLRAAPAFFTMNSTTEIEAFNSSPQQFLKQRPELEESKCAPLEEQRGGQYYYSEENTERSFQYAACFFAMDLPPLQSTSRDCTRVAKTTEPTNTTAAKPRSAPIKMTSNNSLFLEADSTRCNGYDPSLFRSLSDCNARNEPADYIDPVDGHIWHAKYCVLEDGILYFYRHQTDAESPEAAAERARPYTTNASQGTVNNKKLPLGYSPIPHARWNNCIQHDDEEPASGYIWEKRVALECVGAVRSANLEYGENSFELQAVEDDDSLDEDSKLVLRAQDADEFKEWLFQFHRSIATYVMDIMDHMTPLLRGDVHQSQIAHKLTNDNGLASPSRFSGSMMAFSPRFRSGSCWSAAPPLSHGHGRSSMHRRRQKDAKGEPVPSSVPNSPLFPTIMRRRQAEESPKLYWNPRSMTPSQTIPQRERSPSLERTSLTASFTMDMSPELSAPQTSCPETEHPVPSQTYVPPHLRHLQEQQQPPPQQALPAKKYVPPHLRKKTKGGGNGSGGGKYVPPHLRNKPPAVSTGSPCQDKYIPRHLRKGCINNGGGMSLEERAAAALSRSSSDDDEHDADNDSSFVDGYEATCNSKEIPWDQKIMKMGGCADPDIIAGSVLDHRYIPTKASRVGKVHTDPFGFVSDEDGDARFSSSSGLRWEIGAVSECGLRDANEDAYLIVNNIVESLKMQNKDISDTVWNEFDDHVPGLFAVFDGHCGNHAARFAAEKLMEFVHQESLLSVNEQLRGKCLSDLVGEILERAVESLDTEFCNLCVHEGRAWDSGTTAVIATIVNQHLVVANLGDARAVVSKSVSSDEDAMALKEQGWHEIPLVDHSSTRRCFWHDATIAHSPNRDDERARIHRANGWVTTEQEIPIGQFKRMVLFDQDVIDILKRCFADRYQPSPKAAAPQRILQISRVCGELAVSRAIGDRVFKASYNPSSDKASLDSDGDDSERIWDCSLFLPYPENHSKAFVGDLVSNKPEFQAFRVGDEGAFDEFILLACDGLWDVIDSDDAIRVTRDLLYEKKWPAKKAAARLAELAIHLGSSDNITVIVIRFYCNHDNE